MSHRHSHYGGEPPRTQRHSTQMYDPYAESEDGDYDRYQARRDEPRVAYGSSSYGSSGGGSVPRQAVYTTGRSSGGYSTQTFANPVTRSRDSGFPSGIQESDVWRSKDSNSNQQRSSNRQSGYGMPMSETVRRQQSPVWGESRGMSSRYQSNSISRLSTGQPVQLGMSASQQPVLMMVPQGSAGSLMSVMQNPFSVPRQMYVGNIPTALNPNIFDQHVIGNGQYGGSHQLGIPRSSRNDNRSSSAYGREKPRGRGAPSSAAPRRRSSPIRGLRSDPHRNQVFRKPIVPPNSVPRKRVSDRADLMDRKKPKTAQEEKVDRVVRIGISSPSLRNRNRKEKKRKAAAAAAAKAAASAVGKTPEKKAEKKVEDGKKGDSEVVILDSPVVATDEKKEPVVIVASAEDEKGSEIETVTIEDGDGKSEEEKKRKSKFDDFHPALLVCKVCQKSMNDGASFESHLSGRAHMALVKIVEERFQKRADLLMFESRLAEEEIGIELERQRRAGKGTGSGGKNKNHCKMCDCTYTVNWGTHKISLGHRVLKEFLHPTCQHCEAQFVHRMDWLNHLFSLSHLRRISELRKNGKDTSTHESATQEELFAINLEMNKEENPVNFITIRNLDWKVPTKEDLKDILQDDEELSVPNVEITIPDEHDGTVITGKEMILTTTGYCCKVCRTYMTQEKDVDPHCMSKSHYGMYTTYLKKLIKIQDEIKEAAAQEEAEAQAKKAKAEAETAEALKKQEGEGKTLEEPMETGAETVENVDEITEGDGEDADENEVVLEEEMEVEDIVDLEEEIVDDTADIEENIVEDEAIGVEESGDGDEEEAVDESVVEEVAEGVDEIQEEITEETAPVDEVEPSGDDVTTEIKNTVEEEKNVEEKDIEEKDIEEKDIEEQDVEEKIGNETEEVDEDEKQSQEKTDVKETETPETVVEVANIEIKKEIITKNETVELKEVKKVTTPSVAQRKSPEKETAKSATVAAASVTASTPKTPAVVRGAANVARGRGGTAIRSRGISSGGTPARGGQAGRGQATPVPVARGGGVPRGRGSPPSATKRPTAVRGGRGTRR